MSYHETLSFHTLQQANKPKYAVFCDFDETYHHSITDESRKALMDLETFIHSHHLDHKILLRLGDREQPVIRSCKNEAGRLSISSAFCRR